VRPPLIFDIKRYAINDGPGIRVTIFFKGCPLRCKCCHNPESQSRYAEKLYTKSRCIGANDCIVVCPNHALTLTPDGVVTDVKACKLCGKCAETCPTRAMEMSGEVLSVSEIMNIIERERVHIDHSGGGVTFSGGEPLMFPVFLMELLDACGERGFHRTVDTSGYADTKVLLNVAERTDLFLYDLKIMDEAKHLDFTGKSNVLILNNLKTLAESGVNINIRIPLIKNVNADEKNLHETAKFISSLSGKIPPVSLLPYHNIAINKYAKLGIPYSEGEMEEPDEVLQNKAVEIFESYGILAEIGG
jgi:pyruvate formate lyase activating enzyme